MELAVSTNYGALFVGWNWLTLPVMVHRVLDGTGCQ